MKRKLTKKARQKMGHGKNKGRDMGGIKDLETLRNHCRVTEDGCWVYAGKTNPARVGRSVSVYLRALGKVLSIGSAVHYVKTGKQTPSGYHNVAQCGEGLCCNPDHRKIMRRGGHMTVKSKLGKLGPDGSTNLIPKPRKLTDAAVVDIYNTRHETTTKQVAEKYGISESYACALRGGQGRVKRLSLSANGPAGMFSQLLRLAA
jgi:hypothetical protein